jgi:hypothetical protein
MPHMYAPVIGKLYEQGCLVIEALFALVIMIVEAAIAACTFIIELVSGVFVAAGSTIGVFDFFLLVFVLLAELVVWLLLWFKQLLTSAIKLEKPAAVRKPVFWRPKAKPKNKEK